MQEGEVVFYLFIGKVKKGVKPNQLLKGKKIVPKDLRKTFAQKLGTIYVLLIVPNYFPIWNNVLKLLRLGRFPGSGGLHNLLLKGDKIKRIRIA